MVAVLILFCATGARLGHLVGLLYELTSNGNLRTLHDEGMKKVTVEIIAQRHTPTR